MRVVRHWGAWFGAAVALAVVVGALPAAADEMWVAPGDKADHEVGSWGVTNTGAARFSFGVPADLSELTSARVVLLGKKTTSIDWHVDLSISQDGLPHDAITASGDGSAALTAGDVAEVDVTSIFPAALAAGVDVAGLAFAADKIGDVYVVGLRLGYERSNPLAGEGCDDGEVLNGYDDAGDPICVSIDSILGALDCADGEVLVGYDETAGAAICITTDSILAALDCADGEVLVRFDETSGEAVCTTVQAELAGLSCAAGEAVTGFDANGALVCTPLGGGGGGGEGGGGGGTGFSIDDVTKPEGNSGTTTFTFTVTLNPAEATTATVDFTTVDGSATAGSDYTALSGTLTFLPGQTTATVDVSVTGDTLSEGDEQFTVELSNSSGPPIADAIGIGVIVNDDLESGR